MFESNKRRLPTAKSLANLRPKQKGQSTPGAGRKMLMVNQLVKDSGYTKADIRKLLDQMLWLTKSQLKSAAEDTNSPSIVVAIASAINACIRTGDLGKISHMIGMPKQEVALSVVKVGKDLEEEIYQ